MTDTFRLVPPAVRGDWIERPRLTHLLARRFNVDVLLVVAPAGYGKTAALAAAVAANADERLGVDVWFQCDRGDDDADVLAAGLLVATGLPAPGPGFAGSAERVADALLRLAPRQVCLILDDVHLLDPDGAGAALLGDLVEQLPAHAHLVVSGRSRPRLRLARRRAQGRVDELGIDELAFDDAERLRLTAEDGDGDLSVARWPAMAALLGRGEGSETVEFLLEEVASAEGAERVDLLTALAHVRTVDDEVAQAASKGELDAAALLGELPLVHRTPTRAYQMHDLWREALTSAPLSVGARRALGRIAQLRLDQYRHREATELFVAAGDPGGVTAAAEAFALHPLMFVSVGDLRRMADLTTASAPDEPMTAVLNATVAMTGDERMSADAFIAAADVAAAAGEDRVEAIALYNAANMIGVVEPYGFPGWLIERADALADRGDQLGASLSAVLQAHAARAAGDPDRAADLLREPQAATSTLPRVQHAFAMSDLGRPEEVATPDDLDDAAQAGGQYAAQAIWLRGEVSPELALELGRGLVDSADARQVAHVQISTHGVLALVAAAAGDVAEARRLADQAASWTGQTASTYVQTFVALADAATLLLEQGEEASGARLARMLRVVPVEPWPYRSYLYALPLLYALAPTARDALDRCRFGPALTEAQRAGQALVRLREHDDPEPALALPWHRPWLLRAHVLPPHLAQLAAAAAAAGHGEVGQVLDELPSLRDHLQAAVGLEHEPTRTWAESRIARLPARPGHDLSVQVLGTVRAARGATPIADEPWVRRERVRQLLALLLLHRRLSRRQASELLWPDLEPERALQNLRVNLNHLQRVLQPARDRSEPPWFVQVDQDRLAVADEGVVVDAERFEHCCLEARRLDDQARGSQAIEAHREAAALYQGDYVAEWPDAEWAEVERVRLRSLAVVTMARLGELLLARGEPEEASSWAAVSLRHEPLLERAHRLLIRSLAGQGNQPASRTAMEELLARLRDDGIEPERDTLLLADRLGVTGAA